MYLDHFGLGSDPFSLRPHLRFLFDSAVFEETMSHLVYGLEGGEDVVLITGEIGTGKTLALQNLVENIGPAYKVALINVTQVDFDELLKLLIGQLDLEAPPRAGRGDLINVLLSDLRARQAKRTKVLLIIDEAQDLDPESLEGVRLLLNLAQPGDQVLQIVLAGQLGLAEALDLPEMAQLKQRIRVHYRLDTLSPDETGEYVRHRMKVAGCDREVFTREALARIAELSGGVPRLVNALADHSLLAAFVDGSGKVKSGHVEEIDLVRDPRVVRPAAPAGPDPVPEPAPAAESASPEPAAASAATPPPPPAPAAPALATRRRRRGAPAWSFVLILLAAAAAVWLFGFGGVDHLRGDGSAPLAGEPRAAADTAAETTDPSGADDPAAAFEAAEPAPETGMVETETGSPETEAGDPAPDAALEEPEPAAPEVGAAAAAETVEPQDIPGLIDRPGPGYYVHVGSFMDSSRALRLRESLLDEHRTLIWRKVLGETVWFRVFVGPFADSYAAAEADSVLRREPGIIYTLIHRIR